MNNDQSTWSRRGIDLAFNRRDHILSAVIFTLLTLSIVFSVEFPIGLGISKYESINTEDFAVLFLSLWLAKRVLINKERTVGPLLPAVTAMLLVATSWIVLTFGIAAIRSSESVAASALWVMKWLEVVVFFICVQHLLRRYSAAIVIKTVVVGGTILATYSIYASQFLTGWRVRVFFNNPNTLSSFFVLVIALSFAGVIANRGPARLGYTLSGILSGGATLTTLSRSGMIALLVSLTVLAVLHHRDLTERVLVGFAAGSLAVALSMIYVLQDRLFRLVDWIQISPDGIALASGTVAKSFRVRLELLQKSWDLWVEQPIFGYGWFASPSRVGYLDNFYSILAVELGLPGLVLMLALYAVVFRALFQARQNGSPYLANAIIAWFAGLLAMSIGGPFPRSPQMMMLWMLLLVAVWVLAEDGFWTFEEPST